MLKLLIPVYDQISRDNAAHKERKIQWRNEYQEAFEALSILCTPTPFLAFPNYDTPFKLHTNVSAVRLGVGLYQKQDGTDSVIGYASRALSKSESHHPAHKLEFLAISGLSQSSKEYLYGKTFTSYSDNYL